MENKSTVNRDEKILNDVEDSRVNCLTRRTFLLSGASAVVCTLILPGISGAAPKSVKAVKNGYPKELIGRVSELKEGVPVSFSYPNPQTRNFLVKLGVRAGGGIGEQEDIVAFNYLCTHMGGPLNGLYKHEYKAIGPCPLHLTTFDLTRFGIVVVGHATESLPQVILSAEDNNIYATGFMGLIYGVNANL